MIERSAKDTDRNKRAMNCATTNRVIYVRGAHTNDMDTDMGLRREMGQDAPPAGLGCFVFPHSGWEFNDSWVLAKPYAVTIMWFTVRGACLLL